MDEILFEGVRPEGEQAPAPEAESYRQRAERLLFRADAFFEGKRLKPWMFLLAALLIGAVLTFTTVYTRGYTVTVDGHDMGTVTDPAQVNAMAARVEQRVSDILGYDYTLKSEIVYTPRFAERNKIGTLSGLETYLFSQVSEVKKTYTLVVNGEELGTVLDKTGIETILEALKAPYITLHTIAAEFTVPVTLNYEYTPADKVTADRDFESILTANSVEAATYEVVAGDTYSEIAFDHDMTLAELMEMNPQARLDSLYPGDVLTVRQSVPYLSVRTVDKLTYAEKIPSPVEYVEDDTMYEGDTKVLEEGTEGMAMVTARVSYVDGVEESRDVVHTLVMEEATTRVVAQGTQPRPKTAPTGKFIWPCSGTITSSFGYRSIFGSYSFHSGMDIGVAYGTTIVASDGGTVTFAGENGAYGKLVIISHGNGKETYYGHNSRLLVKAGDKVYQGQAIAKAGSTGRSTGPHCHFEIRLWGTAVNPRSYLK